MIKKIRDPEMPESGPFNGIREHRLLNQKARKVGKWTDKSDRFDYLTELEVNRTQQKTYKAELANIHNFEFADFEHFTSYPED